MAAMRLLASAKSAPAPPPTANEQLVRAALQVQHIVESAVGKLEELARLSGHDPLTNIPNRMLMLDRLINAIALARRHKARIAVLFIDLDCFKQINDTMGHGVGDEVLQLVAQRLQLAIRASDTISRHGGDEFLALLPEIGHLADAGRIAEKLLAALSAPVQIGGFALRLSASIGISMYPDDGDDPHTLIDRADLAMYRTKQRVRGGIEYYAG
jgi:diguanylate cyclase (GGDEF)-like protein